MAYQGSFHSASREFRGTRHSNCNLEQGGRQPTIRARDGGFIQPGDPAVCLVSLDIPREAAAPPSLPILSLQRTPWLSSLTPVRGHWPKEEAGYVPAHPTGSLNCRRAGLNICRRSHVNQRFHPTLPTKLDPLLAPANRKTQEKCWPVSMRVWPYPWPSFGFRQDPNCRGLSFLTNKMGSRIPPASEWHHDRQWESIIQSKAKNLPENMRSLKDFLLLCQP